MKILFHKKSKFKILAYGQNLALKIISPPGGVFETQKRKKKNYKLYF